LNFYSAKNKIFGEIIIDKPNLCFGCMEDKGDSQVCSYCGLLVEATAESALHLPPGTVLQGKFLLGRVLGQGGFGITYLAWDMTLNIKLAIKEYLPQQLATRTGGSEKVSVFKPSLSEDFNYGLARFLEEAQTLARFIEHPNVVSVRDYFEANNTAYLVMNYHEGVTLQNYLTSKGGKIPVEQALSIFMPVLDALKDVHAAGILHRDISPDNLLIDRSGRVVLIDFGAARRAMSDKSRSLSVIMKAGYSPPEQYQSRGKQGPWTDIYAVAASFYRSITGQTPLEAVDRLDEDDLLAPSQLGIAIKAKQEQALFKALAVKLKDRYQSVEEFQKALVATPFTGQVRYDYSDGRQKEMTAISKVDVKSGEADVVQQAKLGLRTEAAKGPKKKTESAEKPVGWVPQAAGVENSNPPITSSKKEIKYAAVTIGCGLLLFGAISLLGGGSEPENMNHSAMQGTDRTDDRISNVVIVDVPESSILNLRSGPDNSYSVLDKLKRGAELIVVEEKTGSDGGIWFKVTTPTEKEGWVHSDYVLNKPNSSSQSIVGATGEEEIETKKDKDFYNDPLLNHLGWTVDEIVMRYGNPDSIYDIGGGGGEAFHYKDFHIAFVFGGQGGIVNGIFLYPGANFLGVYVGQMNFDDIERILGRPEFRGFNDFDAAYLLVYYMGDRRPYQAELEIYFLSDGDDMAPGFVEIIWKKYNW
jgi:serine/threonine protein kinase